MNLRWDVVYRIDLSQAQGYAKFCSPAFLDSINRVALLNIVGKASFAQRVKPMSKRVSSHFWTWKWHGNTL